MRRNLQILFFTGCVLAVVIVFYGSSETALMDPDEARYAEASKEMIEQGSYIVPLYNGAPRLNKPVLFYWLQIASYRLFGINEFAARFPSMMAGIASILLVFSLGRLLFRDETAIMAMFIFMTSLFFFAFSRLGTLDIVLLFFFTLSLLAFLKAERFSAQKLMRQRNGYIVLLAISLGFAFLTKGPVGVIVPLLIIIAYLLLTVKLAPFTWKNIISGILVFLAVAAPWSIALVWKVGIADILSLIKKETTERYFVGFDHPQPFYFFIIIFFAGFFPWSSFIPVAAFRKIRSYRQDRSGGELFLLIWLILPLIFFSFSGSKLPGYILPVLPAASGIVASEWLNLRGKEGTGDRKWFFMSGLPIMAAVLLLYLFYGNAVLPNFPRFKTFYISTFVISVLFLVLVAVFSIKKKMLLLFASITAFCALFFFAVILFAMPMLQNMRSTRELALQELRSYEGFRIVSYRYNIPSLLFYSGRKIDLASDERELERIAAAPERSLVIISVKNYWELSEPVKALFKVGSQWNEFMLLVPDSKGRP